MCWQYKEICDPAEGIIISDHSPKCDLLAIHEGAYTKGIGQRIVYQLIRNAFSPIGLFIQKTMYHLYIHVLFTGFNAYFERIHWQFLSKNKQ
jgi:hypothetical protein